MKGDLTQGPVIKSMIFFAVPMILGNLLQQCYNIADTLIVGRFLGPDALAAVGSAFSIMTFLTSVLIGLCMGSSAVFSIRYGKKDIEGLKESIFSSFLLIVMINLLLNSLVYWNINRILDFLNIPEEIYGLIREYLLIIFAGITGVFLFNYFACLLRALGNSVIPLVFLAACAVLNILLDLLFVIKLNHGVAGAAAATVISQYISGIGIGIYVLLKCPMLCLKKRHCRLHTGCLKEIAGFSILTCIQQCVMNLGILMVQGLVNSFGTSVMAAFAAAVKIDSFAYMPVQDLGNAFSSFIAQNYGAEKKERIRTGFKSAIMISLFFCIGASAVIWIFARPLMLMFVKEQETDILAEGIHYLHIEGAFYCGIGILFLLYGLYRALGRPGMSVILTVISLGTRVILSYILSSVPEFGVTGIWWSIPAGWFLADMVGLMYFRFCFLRTLQN